MKSTGVIAMPGGDSLKSQIFDITHQIQTLSPEGSAQTGIDTDVLDGMDAASLRCFRDSLIYDLRKLDPNVTVESFCVSLNEEEIAAEVGDSRFTLDERMRPARRRANR